MVEASGDRAVYRVLMAGLAAPAQEGSTTLHTNPGEVEEEDTPQKVQLDCGAAPPPSSHWKTTVSITPGAMVQLVQEDTWKSVD
jgi:hypothetical protein